MRDVSSLVPKLGEAQAFFEEATSRADLCDPMAAAHARGRKREPRTVNVFVHPEFAWMQTIDTSLPAELVASSIERYRLGIANALADSSVQAVITFDGARDFYDGFAYDDKKAIATLDLTGDGMVQGMLDAAGMRRFVEQLGSIRHDDRFAIHGAAFNRCPSHFAKQVLGLAVFGLFVPPTHSKTDLSAPESIHQRTLIESLYHSWYIVHHTRIRLGIQHDTWNTEKPDSLTQDLCEDGITKVISALGKNEAERGSRESA